MTIKNALFAAAALVSAVSAQSGAYGQCRFNCPTVILAGANRFQVVVKIGKELRPVSLDIIAASTTSGTLNVFLDRLQLEQLRQLRQLQQQQQADPPPVLAGPQPRSLLLRLALEEPRQLASHQEERQLPPLVIHFQA